MDSVLLITMNTHNNRGWIWFFVILTALAVSATVILIVFNLQQQLKPEQLEAARQLWKKNDIRDYTMTYTVRTNDQEKADRYFVKVQGGKVVEAKFNGQAEPAGRLHHYGMDRLFAYIEDFHKIDSEKGKPRTFVRAIFDEQKTGGLRWYVRRVMGGNERQEITVGSFQVP